MVVGWNCRRLGLDACVCCGRRGVARMTALGSGFDAFATLAFVVVVYAVIIYLGSRESF